MDPKMYSMGVSSVGDVCKVPDTVNSQAPGTKKNPKKETSAADMSSQNRRTDLGITISARSTLTRSPVSTEAPVPSPTMYNKATRDASSVHNGGCGRNVRANTCTMTATIINAKTTKMAHLISRSICFSTPAITILHIPSFHLSEPIPHIRASSASDTNPTGT